DGLWNWGLNGTSTPDWSSSQQLPVFYKSGIGRNNDNPYDAIYDNTRMSSRDGHSVSDYTYSVGTGYHNKWFTPGKRHTSLGVRGTDRVFTNAEEVYCSRETMGDRWDAWVIGYNQVFSPYSSPNTKDINNNQTGIFIYYDNLSSEVATVKVYQAAANTEDEDAILEATPPSKPMVYRSVEIASCNGTYGYPRVIWDNNLEPDMVRSAGISSTFKRYKIYRATSDNSNIPPLAYYYIGTYDDYSPNDTANFIDNDPYNGVLVSCSLLGNNNNNDYWRYKIVAVDKYDDVSVMSDFVSIMGYWVSSPDRPNNIHTENPVKFELSQNYPNPFNPTTEINFSLKQSNFITIIVYNAIGEEIARLVNNEYRDAGKYSVNFDGSNLASGIYFYSIEAGVFKDVKKMVLIK
ncbi:MAG: T9SS type A sorting domain-containing protein, partial [Ignavibacteria bacterium]|nr:T9SS type A sorting domain-containing protein [Ignavibacteria bacterium]